MPPHSRSAAPRRAPEAGGCPLSVRARQSEAFVLAASLGWTLLLWSVCWAVFTPAYGSNDDPVRAMIVSGTGFAPAPDEHLLFSNVLPGRLLRRLYLRWPWVPWYDATLVGLNALAHAVLVYAAFRKRAGPATLLLYLCYLGASGLFLAITLQFTMTAFAAAQAGLLLGLSLMERPATGRARWMVAALAASVAGMGALIRSDAFWLALGLAAVPAVVLCIGRRMKEWAPVAAVGFAAAGLTLASGFYDQHYYAREPAWAEYREFHSLIHELLDVRRVEDDREPAVAAAIRDAGWSRNDFRLLRSWFYPDAAVFSTSTLRQVLDRLPPPAHRAGRVTTAFRRMWTSPWSSASYVCLSALVLAVLGSRRNLVLLLATVAVTTAALVVLALWWKLPSHVWIPVATWPIVAPLAGCHAARLRPGRRSLGAAAALLAVIGLGRTTSELWDEGLQRARVTRELTASLGTIPPGTFLVTWALTFPYEAAPPMNGRWMPAGVTLFPLGWAQRTPTARTMLARHGIHDLGRALAWHPEVILAAPPEVAPALEQYVRRHAHTRARFVVHAATPSFTVLRPVGPRALPAREEQNGAETENGVHPARVLESAPAAGK